MTIEINAIYNFLVSLFFVTSAFMLGMIFKNKLKSPGKLHGDSHQESSSAQNPNHPASDYKASGIQTPNPYQKALEETHNQAKILLNEASESALAMIAGSKKTNEHAEENLDRILSQIAASDIRSLKETTENFEKEYKEVLKNLELEMQKVSAQIVETAKTQYEQNLNEFLKTLLKNGTATQEAVDKKTAELISIAEADIAEYKKQKMTTVDEEIRKIVQRVYKDVLRESIPENLHKDLIMKSLEEAKRDELFNL